MQLKIRFFNTSLLWRYNVKTYGSCLVYNLESLRTDGLALAARKIWRLLLYLGRKNLKKC